MVVGHRWCRSDRRRVLRRAHHGAIHRTYIVGHVDCANLASDHVLVYPQTPGAHQNPDNQERHRQPRANHQGPQEELQR